MCLDEVGVATVSPAAIQLIFVLVCPEIMEKKNKPTNPWKPTGRGSTELGMVLDNASL